MKLTPYDRLGVEYPPPSVETPLQIKYPDYYILKIDDIVDDFVKQWDFIISTEIMQHPIDSNVVLPEVYTIGEDGTLHKTVYFAQHVSERVKPWHPDISIILAATIETIKAKNEAETDMDLVMGSLWVDVAYMADIHIRSNVGELHVNRAITGARRAIAKLSTQFGKKIYQRLIEYGLYKQGYFPYHYVGWEDECAIVALDDTHR
jgi:hypothetical protein